MENQAKLFLNWTNEDFVGVWNSVQYPVKAGQQFFFEDWKADHFAKHLVDRELNKLNKRTTDPSRVEMLSKCFPQSEPMEEEFKDMPVDMQILNQKKVGRPKKTQPKAEKEEEFEGLN